MYILKCANGEYYTGSTTNLERRLGEHGLGIGANFTWKHIPAELVYKEEFDSEFRAFEREHQIKKWSREKKKALIAGDFQRLKELAKSRKKRIRVLIKLN